MHIFNSDVGTVTGQTYNGITAGQSLNIDSIRFLPGAKGTFINCIFNGVVQFGSDVSAFTNPIFNYPPDYSDLAFQGCEFRGTIVGAGNGMSFLDCFGTIICHDGVCGAIALTGSNIIFDGAVFTAQQSASFIPYNTTNGNAYVLKFVQNRGGYGASSKGNIVVDCIFDGGAQESLGWDSTHTSRAVGHILNVDSNAVTLLPDIAIPYGDSPLTGVSYALGMHLYIASGPNDGAYYEVIEQNDSVLTLDTSKFPPPQVGDIFNLGAALVESTWERNMIHANGQPYNPTSFGSIGYKFGYGCNIGMSFWGCCYGNQIIDNEVIADGDPRLPATGYHDLGIHILGSGRLGSNSYNIWRGNHLTDARVNPTGVLMGLGAGTVQYDPIGVEACSPPTIAFSNHCVYTNNIIAGKSRIGYANKVTLEENVFEDFSILNDGYIPQDYRHGMLYWDEATPSGWYNVWDAAGMDENGNLFQQYWLPKNEPAPVTFIAQDIFPTMYDLADSFLAITKRVSGSVESASNIDDDVTTVISVDGSIDSDGQVFGTANKNVEYVCFDLAESFLGRIIVANPVEGSVETEVDVRGVVKGVGLFPSKSISLINPLRMVAIGNIPNSDIIGVCIIDSEVV